VGGKWGALIAYLWMLLLPTAPSNLPEHLGSSGENSIKMKLSLRGVAKKLSDEFYPFPFRGKHFFSFSKYKV